MGTLASVLMKWLAPFSKLSLSEKPCQLPKQIHVSHCLFLEVISIIKESSIFGRRVSFFVSIKQGENETWVRFSLKPLCSMLHFTSTIIQLNPSGKVNNENKITCKIFFQCDYLIHLKQRFSENFAKDI